MHGSHAHHHGHDHAHGDRHRAALGAPSLSLLRMGAGPRLAGAFGLAALLWALVALVIA